MATKVKPSRINISWTPQAWDVPVYVDEDCFCWWQNWAWDVTWPASSTDWNVAVFDWCTWKAIKDSWKSINCLAQLCDMYCYAQCCDIPTDNCQLSNGCNYLKSCDLPDLSWYQLKCNMVCDLTWADNNHYPTAKAVVDAMGCLWWWDMLKATYDPCNCSDDAFDYNNFYNTPNMCCYAQICDIPTDNCQLANWCCYADCDYVNNSINSVTAYYITKNAQWDQFATYAELAAATTFYSGWQVRIPTRNDYTIVLADENHDNATTRYIYNSGWEYQYTVNETALTQAQLDALNSGITCSKVDCYDNCMAQCCDIPTNNCQLTNWCWYITGINCNDVTTALWYTPAQCCDIPTDNCQLWNTCWYIKWITCSDVTNALWYTPYNNTNPNWYTSCTWTLQACDLCWYAECCDLQCYVQECCVATINGCCLTQWGNICISWWGWVSFKSADILIVWWGGAGWGWCAYAWWWGGGWEVIEMSSFLLWWSSYNIIVGSGWTWVSNADWWNWSSSCFWIIEAKWWWGWKKWGCNQGHWWLSWSSNGWGYGSSRNWWWGWWTIGAGETWTGGQTWICNVWGSWWAWYYSNISWVNIGYWWGWWGWTNCVNYTWKWSAWWWNGWYNATWCWWGWGWAICASSARCWYAGWNWVVIVSYWENWECGIHCATWWTVYCCNWYVIHCFTSDWTFTIIS